MIGRKQSMRMTIVAPAALALVVGAAAPLAAQDSGWRLRLGPLAAASTSGGDQEIVAGAGLGLEYRTGPRLGIEIGAMTAEPRETMDLAFFDEAKVHLESRVRVTPVTARLDLHLTPEARADVYVAPVVAYVHTSPVTVTASGAAGGESFRESLRFDTKDQFAWGAALGVDLPLGQGRSFLSLSATYLRVPLKLRAAEEEGPRGDIDPLFVSLAYGLRL
jgi:hypothetical protein